MATVAEKGIKSVPILTTGHDKDRFTVTNKKKLPHFFALLPVSSLPSSDIMPGYTAPHSACKKTTNLRAKFYGKTALNGEIPANKYQDNINHMS